MMEPVRFLAKANGTQYQFEENTEKNKNRKSRGWILGGEDACQASKMTIDFYNILGLDRSVKKRIVMLVTY